MIAWLSDLKLSLSQWLLLLLATCVGGLVVALKLQGSQLHKAQVELLSSRVKQTTDVDNEARKEVLDTFQAAYKAYIGAKHV
jgi:hypothetical protein